ncbi:MAG: dUTP diphosphatase [Sulfuricurvum sp.]
MDKLLIMLQLQNSLNDATNGEKWVNGITKNNKKINWRRCIYMECAESVDSFAWKHWKDISKEPDWQNLQIEVVDIWHFVMSLAIEEYAKNSKGSLEEIAGFIAEAPYFEEFLVSRSEFGSEQSILDLIEEMMLLALDKNSLDLDKLFRVFFTLASLCKLDLTQLYALYIGKNILNKFRQDNGYKDGSYIKIWGGSEDNVVMQDLLQKRSDLSPDELYEELARSYFSLTRGN